MVKLCRRIDFFENNKHYNNQLQEKNSAYEKLENDFYQLKLLPYPSGLVQNISNIKQRVMTKRIVFFSILKGQRYN